MFKKLFAIGLLIPFFISINTSKATAQQEKYEVNQSMVIESKSVDPRAIVLKNYLAQYNSPLTNHAQDFIDAADKYQLDWKLVPAIAGVESTFGKRIPGGYNGWGWGVYGTNAIYFTSWREAIFTVTKGLKEDYFSRGLTDPYALNTRYASSPHWGKNVSYFLADIEKYSKRYNLDSELTIEKTQAQNTAGSSAQLALKFVQIGGI